MPFYRYECRNCGHAFRYLHVGEVNDDVTCPKCGGADLERQMPRVAVQFKGSGYYKTDRANKKSKVGTKGSSEKDTSSDSGSESSRDSSDSKSSANSKSEDGAKSRSHSQSDKQSKRD